MDFSIGDLARMSGVKVPTIRYYEQAGLLPPPLRTEGNQRRFGQPDLERLQFIRHARDLGLPMEAIRDLLELSAHPEAPCSRADEIAATQLKAVRHKIERLRRLETELQRIVAACGHDHVVADCQVLRALGNHALCAGEH